VGIPTHCGLGPEFLKRYATAGLFGVASAAWIVPLAQEPDSDASGLFSRALTLEEETTEWNRASITRAVTAYRQVLELDPKHRDTRERLARLGWRFAVMMEMNLATEKYVDAAWMKEYIVSDLSDIFWRTEYRSRQENADATLALGLFYQYGILTEANQEKACELFERASGENLMPAVFRHALCVRERNPTGARGLLRKAARMGHPEAQHEHGEAMLADPEGNPEKAAEWIHKAATQGRPSSQALLAWLYYKGTGVPKDEDAAFSLYSIAAARGNPIALNNLGEIFEQGRIRNPQPEIAADYYRKAAEQGFPPAQINLSRVLALGIGVRKDECAALRWALKADSAGFPPASDVVKWLKANTDECPNP
jgi:TPR repeat protein